MINLGYARSSTLVSFVTGTGIDIACSYLLIYRWEWGVLGAALTSVAVQVSRVVMWFSITTYYGINRVLFIPSTPEALISWKEVKVFLSLVLPSLAGSFSGWLIFELQIMFVANIKGISTAAQAAGAIWIQSESTLASIQQGWISVIQMRSLI